MSDGLQKIFSAVNGDGAEVAQGFAAANALSDGADLLSQGLYALSETVIRGMLPDQRGGGLGGDFGYGANFENDVFMMHRYCWCEKPECLWCCIWLSNETECTEAEAAAHREKHVRQVRERYGDWAAEHPGAPHFWHKLSGLQVRWYKWIGRSMEINQEIDGGEWLKILQECLESLPQEARDKALAESAHEQTDEYKEQKRTAFEVGMKTMREMFEALEPCYRCSMDENTLMQGGEMQTGGGVKINKVWKRSDGSCPNCGHVTTQTEATTLAERQEVMNASWRKMFSEKP